MGEYLGTFEDDELWLGGIRNWVLHNGEVLWQEGMAFEDSPWVCVRKAQPVEHITSHPDYIGPEKLSADAKAGLWERPGNRKGEMAFVYVYLERPTREAQKGKMLMFAAGELIRHPADYPRTDNGPCLHKLPWIPQPGKHRDLGAGEMLVDVQRTWNKTINQIVQWKNLVLLPQMKAPVGSIVTDPTDESGVIIEYRPIAGKEPEWREVPEIPVSLFKMLDLCLDDFDHILGMERLPPGLESGSGMQAFEERRRSSQDLFTTNFARWWASFGGHLLYLIRTNYNEPRMLEVQGRFAVERVPDFVGQKIGSGCTVRVAPASIEPRSKGYMEQRLLGYAERGWLEPHQVMAAINGGVAAQLIDSYELDIARQYREIEQLLAIGGWKPDGYFQRAIDVYALQGGNAETLPPHIEEVMPAAPMAEAYDDHAVHIDVMEQWMKTTEFEQQPPLVKQGAKNHLAQHQFLVDQEIQAQAMAQAQRAVGLGMGNAGKLPGQKAPPSPAGVSGGPGQAQLPAGS
jgi:hypothetical protein